MKARRVESQVARAMIGVEEEIFDGLDVSIKHLSSLDKKQDKIIGLREESVGILREIADPLRVNNAWLGL